MILKSCWDLPHVIGAIDGKQLISTIKVILVRFCLQYVMLNINFRMVDVGQYGSTNDSVVLLDSIIGGRFESNSLNIPNPEPIVLKESN